MIMHNSTPDVKGRPRPRFHESIPAGCSSHHPVCLFLPILFRVRRGVAQHSPCWLCIFPLKFIVPVESVLEVALSVLLVPGAVRKVDRANLLRLLGGAVPGSLVGVFLLASWANRPMEIILGAAVIGVGLFFLRNTPSRAVLSSPMGVGGGSWREDCWEACSEPAVRPTWLSSQARPWTEAAFRATLIVLFAVEYAWRLGLYAHQGLLDFQGLQLALSLLPALVAATLLGHFVHLRVGEKVFRRWAAVFLLASGTLCLI